MMWQAANQVVLAAYGSKHPAAALRRVPNWPAPMWVTPGVSWQNG
jgi:hypothetical protein